MEPEFARLRAGSVGADGIPYATIRYFDVSEKSIYRAIPLLLTNREITREIATRAVFAEACRLGFDTGAINTYLCTTDHGMLITFSIHRSADDDKEPDLIKALVKVIAQQGTIVTRSPDAVMKLPAEMALLTHPIIVSGPPKHPLLTDLAFAHKTSEKGNKALYFMATLTNAQSAIKIAPPITDSVVAHMMAHHPKAGFYLLNPIRSYSDVMTHATMLKTELFGIWRKNETAQTLIMVVDGQINVKLQKMLEKTKVVEVTKLGATISKYDVLKILASKLKQQNKKPKKEETADDLFVLNDE
jgi:hypothetical protein